MIREKTLKGIADLQNEEAVCRLIEVQQELSLVRLHFSQAIEAFYGESPSSENAIKEFYDKSRSLDGIINEWLGSMLYTHFAVIR